MIGTAAALTVGVILTAMFGGLALWALIGSVYDIQWWYRYFSSLGDRSPRSIRFWDSISDETVIGVLGGCFVLFVICWGWLH